MFKRILAAVLVASAVLAFAACDNIESINVPSTCTVAADAFANDRPEYY